MEKQKAWMACQVTVLSLLMMFNPNAICVPVACLIAVMMRAFYGLVSDGIQNLRAAKYRRAVASSEIAEISERLHQTFVELSASKRKASWRELMIVKVVQESEDVKSFYLVNESLEPLPSALPGQHILVEREKQLDFVGGCRCYTLSDNNSDGHWRISVKKSSNNPNSISRWLHEEKEVGDTLKVKGPSGAFYFKPVTGRDVVLASAGIGITPMLPMLIESIRQGSTKVNFFTQCRDLEHMPFADSLLDIAKKHPQIRMSFWVSRWPNGIRRPGKGIFNEGKFQARDLLQHPGALTESDFFLCGPELWQEQIKTNLLAAGVPSASIRYELFQQSEKPQTVVNFANHRVHFLQSGANAKFESSHASLLACAGKNSVQLESGCRTGACGSCAVKLLSGKVRYTREPQFQMQTSEILPCVCVPDSDLEVDA